MTIDERIARGLAMVAATVPTEDPTPKVPDVSMDELTAQIVTEALDSTSVVVIRGFLLAPQVCRLRDYLDRGAGRILPGEDSQEVQAELLDYLAATYRDRGFIDLVTAVLGEVPVASTIRTAVRRTGPSLGLNWHQDASFFGGRVRAVNVWIALTPCGDVCPAVEFIPEALGTIFDPHQEVPAPQHRAIEAARTWSADHRAFAPVLEPGDALIFDEMTLHRTSLAPWTTEVQDVAITWFFAPSRFPADHTPLAL